MITNQEIKKIDLNQLNSAFTEYAIDIERMEKRLGQVSFNPSALFGIARAIASLTYGQDMATSSLSCLEDAQYHIEQAIKELKSQHNIKG